jgi:GNAT superfamily N-acetyltransferase
MFARYLNDRLDEPAPHARAGETAPDSGFWAFRLLQTKRTQDARLALRPVRPSDGDALQTYVRGLSPQSRYSRFLGAASELPPSELARALAANGRDTLTLLVTSMAEDRETVVGEARVALWCAERAGEFGMSIADEWRHLGVGSALLLEIERKASADGIEWLYGDTLRTNEAMIGLALSRGFRIETGLEARLVRLAKPLEDAVPDLPCRKWKDIGIGPELRTA